MTSIGSIQSLIFEDKDFAKGLFETAICSNYVISVC